MDIMGEKRHSVSHHAKGWLGWYQSFKEYARTARWK